MSSIRRSEVQAGCAALLLKGGVQRLKGDLAANLLQGRIQAIAKQRPCQLGENTLALAFRGDDEQRDPQIWEGGDQVPHPLKARKVGVDTSISKAATRRFRLSQRTSISSIVRITSRGNPARRAPTDRSPSPVSPITVLRLLRAIQTSRSPRLARLQSKQGLSLVIWKVRLEEQATVTIAAARAGRLLEHCQAGHRDIRRRVRDRARSSRRPGCRIAAAWGASDAS
jgi:hypothetical protein